MTIAAIAAPMTASPGVGTFAASEAMLRMTPPPARIMPGSTARDMRICPNAVVCRTPGISSNRRFMQQLWRVIAARRIEDDIDCAVSAMLSYPRYGS